MAHGVSRRPFTAKARVRSLSSPYEICGGKSGTGTGFCPSASVFRCQHYSINTPNSSSSACYSYQDDERAKPVNLPNNQCSVGNRGAVDRKVPPHFLVLKMLISVTKCRYM